MKEEQEKREKGESNSLAGTKVSEEGGAGDAPGATACGETGCAPAAHGGPW